MSSNSQSIPVIKVEVPNKPLPVRMRLTSLRARPGSRGARRRTLTGLTPLLPVVGLAGLTITLRRGHQPQ